MSVSSRRSSSSIQDLSRPSTPQPHPCNYCNRSPGRHGKRALAKDAVGHFIDKFRHNHHHEHHHHHHHGHHDHRDEGKSELYLAVPTLPSSPGSDTESINSFTSSLKRSRPMDSPPSLDERPPLIKDESSSSLSDDSDNLFSPLDTPRTDAGVISPLIPVELAPEPLVDDVDDKCPSFPLAKPESEQPHDALELLPPKTNIESPEILPETAIVDEEVSDTSVPPPAAAPEPAPEPILEPIPEPIVIALPSPPTSSVPEYTPSSINSTSVWLDNLKSRLSHFRYLSAFVSPATSLLKYYSFVVLGYGVITILQARFPALRGATIPIASSHLPYAYVDL